MKKQFLKTAILFVCIASVFVSCDKKEMDDMNGMDITMSYTPNPALKNTPITFTFDVMQDGKIQAVTNTSCEVIMTGMADKVMTTTEITAGQYGGTYTFTEAGTYSLHFKYMHGMTESDKDFTCVVE